MGRNKLKPNQDKNKQIKISQTLVVKPPQRASVGIEKWRSALQMADRGRRSSLIELIKEIMDSDPVFWEAWDKRVRAITNSDIVFQINGVESEPIMDLIDTTEFEDLLKETINTIGFGKTIIELNYEDRFKANLIDRRHVNTEIKQILINPFDTTGISYQDDEFLLNIGKDEDLGLFTKVIAYAIFKRNGGADYAQYCELFGIPMLAAYYDPEDESGRQELEDTLYKRGGAGHVVMSKNGKLETIGSEAAANNPVHGGFLKWCDEQILIGLIGQTMTTKDGSSYSQGKVHSDTENDINKSDRRYVQRVLNELVLPKLEKRGYPVKGGWFSFVEKEKALTKKEQLEIAISVDDRTEYGIDEAYWYENFGLPKGSIKKQPEQKEPEQMEEDPGQEKAQEPEQKTTGTKTKKIQAQELSLWNKLKDFFGGAPR